jgi:hypothetical protein
MPVLDLRGHYSNLPAGKLRPLMIAPEWRQRIHELHVLLSVASP